MSRSHPGRGDRRSDGASGAAAGADDGSANRDPAHFTGPDRLDLTRYPNRHLAFGFGTHFCLGASLDRLEIRVFLEELTQRVRALRLAPGFAVEEMPNAFVYGLRAAHLDLDFE